MPVLMDRIGHGLARKRILQLQRDQGNAVDAQHHIQRLLRLRAEMKLAGDRHPVGPIALLQFGVEAMGRPEEGHPQRAPEALETMAQGGQGPVAVHPLAQGGQDPLSGLLPVQGLQLAPFLWLGLADKLQHRLGKDGPLAVEGSGRQPDVTVGQQRGLDGGFKGGFTGRFHPFLTLSRLLVKLNALSLT